MKAVASALKVDLKNISDLEDKMFLTAMEDAEKDEYMTEEETKQFIVGLKK